MALIRLPVQCACGAFTVLETLDEVIRDCEDCETIHVAVAGAGVCRRCGITIERALQVNIDVDPAGVPHEE